MAELITGAGGQLGQALTELFPDAHAPTHQELDITDQEQLVSYDWSNIDAIYNAAAYTDVDGAETPEGKVMAWAVNRDGVRNLGRVAMERGIPLLHVSTDYVFDGTKEGAYTETDEPNPLGEYGASKLAGEQELADIPDSYIVRASWVTGNSNNFIRLMGTLVQDKEKLTVVEDQIGRPAFAKDLALALQHLRDSDAEPGLYHFSNDGEPVSRDDLVRTIRDIMGADCKVNGTTTAEYYAGQDDKAARPLNSTFDLSKIKATGLDIRDWREALQEYLRN